MSDSTITIILVTCVILLMFFFPFLFITAQQDTITANDVKAITETFVNRVAIEGKITESNYNNFKSTVNATGNTYTVELEAQRCNNYPGDSSKLYYIIGKNMYYSEFTDVIEKTVFDKGGYGLKKGDYIKVKVENNNTTIATKLKEMAYGLTGKDYSEIYANTSELVVATTQRDGVDPGALQLSSLDWQSDFYWVPGSKFDWPTDESYWTKPSKWEKVDDGSISKIKIEDYRIRMIGNGVNQGKGACWATTSEDITSIRFDYSVFKRR